jgi:hypothetical protein
VAAYLGAGYVDRAICRDNCFISSHGACSEFQPGRERRRSDTLRRHLSGLGWRLCLPEVGACIHGLSRPLSTRVLLTDVDQVVIILSYVIGDASRTVESMLLTASAAC